MRVPFRKDRHYCMSLDNLSCHDQPRLKQGLCPELANREAGSGILLVMKRPFELYDYAARIAAMGQCLHVHISAAWSLLIPRVWLEPISNSTLTIPLRMKYSRHYRNDDQAPDPEL